MWPGLSKSMTLKCPLNITQLQHLGQLSCQDQTTDSAHTHACTHTPTHTHTHSHTYPVCLPMLSAAFCSLFSWDAKCRWDESVACAQSQEELPLKSKHLYEYQNTQGTVQDERRRGRRWGRERERSRERGRERKSSKTAKKSQCFFLLLYLWRNKAIYTWIPLSSHCIFHRDIYSEKQRCTTRARPCVC